MTPFPREDYRAVTRYSPGREPAEVDLSDNTNLWGTHPAALERIRSASTDDLARYPQLYADVLRDAVAERFDVSADCVTTGAGSDDVLDSAFRAVWGPGAVVSYAAPTFSMVEPLARMNGLEARPVSWPLAWEEPERLLEGDPALIYVCRPNNPTGELVPTEWVERLIGMVGLAGPLLLLDEAYGDFAGETFIGTAATTPRVLVARTASKAYGLAGLRCGFGVGTPETALEIEKSRGPYKVSGLTAAAAADAIRDREGWMQGTVADAVANRDRLWHLIADRGLQPFESHANFILFRAPSGSAKRDVDALRAHGVQLRAFDGIPELGEGLRVTVGPWPLMERFLDALDAVIADIGSVGVEA